MIFNFFGKRGSLGIDVGTSSIKVVELGSKNNRFELLNYGAFELKGLKSDNSQNHSKRNQNILKLPDQEIVWGIKEVLKRAGIKSKDVVASVPSFSTFATVIEMPYISERDLAKAIPIEARKYVPIPMNEVILDWSIVGSEDKADRKLGNNGKDNSDRPPSNVEVFIAAVPKDETIRYQGIVKNAGLNLKALELENSALIRGLVGNDLSSTAIVNIGGRSTSIILVSKGYERLSHNYEIGGFEITRAVSRSLNVSIDRAEGLKKQFGLLDVNENVAKEAMVSLVDMMVFETKKTINHYEESKGDRVSRVILTGGISNMPGFVDYFKNKLDRDAFIGNVMSRIMYDKKLEPIVNEIGNTFSVASGLAMRKV